MGSIIQSVGTRRWTSQAPSNSRQKQCKRCRAPPLFLDGSNEHFAVAECGDPEVAEQYLPIIHLVFANLKTWLIGIHHGVSHQHLQAYLNEFTFRFNRRFYPFNAFRSLLGIAGDTSAPTYAELYSGEWRHPTCSGHGR